MKPWPDKVIIGLTGNIATGKSVVRRMLEHLGAFGIDADALGHRALDPASAGYTKVLDVFGADILDEKEYIDRKKLGRIVFSDPAALKHLESIVHPLIRQAIRTLIENAAQKVIVIEAIKLLEGDLHTICDSIWVTESAPDNQLERLKTKRKMRTEDALQRIQSQPPQAQKLSVADVVIHNDGSFESTWGQVRRAWHTLFPDPGTKSPAPLTIAGMALEYAKPEQASEIADFMNKTGLEEGRVLSTHIVHEFGHKTFMLLRLNDRIIGAAGWATNNLVAIIDNIFLAANIDAAQALQLLIREGENASRTRQCEVCMLVIPVRYAKKAFGWESMGYEITDLTEIKIQAWVEAVREHEICNAVVFIKPLRPGQVFSV